MAKPDKRLHSNYSVGFFVSRKSCVHYLEEGFNHHWDNETDEYWKFMQGLAYKVNLRDAIPAKSIADLLKV